MSLSILIDFFDVFLQFFSFPSFRKNLDFFCFVPPPSRNLCRRRLGGRSPPIPVPCPPGGVWGAWPPRKLRYPCLASAAAVPCPRALLPIFFPPNFFVRIFFRPICFRPDFFRPSSVVARILNHATHGQPLARWSEKSRHQTDSMFYNETKCSTSCC